AEAAALLGHDVTRTVGVGYRDLVTRVAENLAAYGLGDAEKLVEDVQQEFHDLYVDTTWPACPRHGRHPLWYHEDGWWWCEADSVALHRLGELPAP
ncbi:MAG TPA: hypothetical protein VGD56_06735, partial [Gemmatirosa sp.]